jgi:hypothetical protein
MIAVNAARAALPGLFLALALMLAGCDIDSLLAADFPTGDAADEASDAGSSRQSRNLPDARPTPRPKPRATPAPRQAAWPDTRPAEPDDELSPEGPLDREDDTPAEEPTPDRAPEPAEGLPMRPYFPTPVVDTVDPFAIFTAGVQRDLVGQNQNQRFMPYYRALSAGDQRAVVSLLQEGTNDTERVFILKALIAGEPWQNVVSYGEAIRGMPEQQVISLSTMRDPMDLIQQWNDSCGPSLLQAIVGETDPRYAFELNRHYHVTEVDPFGLNKELADQQKQWLEQYGGIAIERGGVGGKGIPINEMLNEKLLPLVNTSYHAVEIVDMSATLTHIADCLDRGFDVPLRLSWSPPGSAEDSGHFLLAIAADGTPGDWRFQVHDSFTGKTEWVSQASLESDSFAPIFKDYARLTHYYEPTPLD